MRTKKEDFYSKLEFGEEGEKIIGQLLLSLGYSIQPLYQYKKDKTPYIFYEFQDKILSITAPDIPAIKDGILYFIECKHKNNWVRNWRGLNEDGSDNLETGLDVRHLKDYLLVFDITSVPVDIYFIHENEEPLGIYRIKINKETRDLFRPHLYPEYIRFGNMKIKDKETSMAFFDIKDLEKIK